MLASVAASSSVVRHCLRCGSHLAVGGTSLRWFSDKGEDDRPKQKQHKGKKRQSKNKDDAQGDASRNAWHIKIMDAPPGPGSKALSPEVQERHKEIGHRYNVEVNRRMRAEMTDLQRKIKLKLEAIEALPPELKKEAMILDTTPFPKNQWVTWTPPIPGFEPDKYDLPSNL